MHDILALAGMGLVAASRIGSRVSMALDEIITARCIRGEIFSRTIDPRPEAVQFYDIAHPGC